MAINRWGLIPDLKTGRDWDIRDHVQLDTSIPSKGSNRLLYIKNQGTHGSCTGFGVTRAMRMALSKAGLPDIDLSELFAYSNNRVESGLSPTVDTGASIRGSMDAARKYGICVEEYWNYKYADAYLNVRPEKYAFDEALSRVALETYSVPNSPDNIRKALAAGFGVSLGVTVWQHAFEEAHNGDVSMPQQGDFVPGAHNIVLDSWDDNAARYGFPNSWGPTWGNQGCGTMPYDYVQQFGSDLWVLSLVKTPPTPVKHTAHIVNASGTPMTVYDATSVTVDNKEVWHA